MTSSIANQTFHSPPNVLQGGSVPNTLGGVGRPEVAVRLRHLGRPYVAAASIAVATAFVLLLSRA